jgi:hypothetical protein
MLPSARSTAVPLCGGSMISEGRCVGYKKRRRNTHGIPALTEIPPPLPKLWHCRSWASASAAMAKTSVANAIVNAAMVFISFRSMFYFSFERTRPRWTYLKTLATSVGRLQTHSHIVRYMPSFSYDWTSGFPCGCVAPHRCCTGRSNNSPTSRREKPRTYVPRQ